MSPTSHWERPRLTCQSVPAPITQCCGACYQREELTSAVVCPQQDLGWEKSGGPCQPRSHPEAAAHTCLTCFPSTCSSRYGGVWPWPKWKTRPVAVWGRTSSSRATSGSVAPRVSARRGREGASFGPRPHPFWCHYSAPWPPQEDERAPIRDRPRVTAPPLPVKNRPFSRGPEKQGVTPTIRVGDPRSRPSSLSLFTQPLNPGLLMATCGNRE